MLSPSSSIRLWGGVKYAVNEKLDLIGAIYYAQQNNFSTTPCTGTGIHTSSASCAGTFDAFSFLIDYRPVQRVDLYAGVALSNVYRGLASGFLQTQNIDPTVGLRHQVLNASLVLHRRVMHRPSCPIW